MIVIGEKINGAIPSVAQAIKNRDSEAIRLLAEKQTDAGADYLDVCAGTSPEQERQTLEWLIEIVENAVPTPICIDSPYTEILAAVIPSVRKDGIVNSVSGEGSKCDDIFPIVARSGWKIVALTCDDSGIPTGAEKKAEIADSLIETARSYGITEDRIFIDPLVFALSVVNDALLSFSGSIQRIRQHHKRVKFISGLSNISFGMPCRKYINRYFLAFAIQAGMDSAILDPTDGEIYAAMLSAEVLLGKDKFCMNYNKAYRAGRL
jgi:5-methyltetrahydrofolate corrinoid/iron sulfur protein methyltransferase